jgi:hypothetical protein
VALNTINLTLTPEKIESLQPYSRNYDTYIEVSKLDGKHRLVLIQEKLSSPRAIAVNPIKR